MPKIGVLVKVGNYPEFANGRIGRVVEHESSDRFLIQLEKIPSLDEPDPVILSLLESEFTLVDNGLEGFLYPHSRYYGSVKPQNMVFNANFQEFSLRISFLAALQTGGKLSPSAVYEQAKLLWDELEKSKNNLGISDEETLT